MATFARWLKHEPAEWDPGLYKRGSPLLLCEDTGRSQQATDPKQPFTRTRSCWHPDLGRPASRTVRNSFLVFIRHWSGAFCYSSWNRLRHHHSTCPNASCSRLAVCTCISLTGMQVRRRWDQIIQQLNNLARNWAGHVTGFSYCLACLTEHWGHSRNLQDTDAQGPAPQDAESILTTVLKSPRWLKTQLRRRPWHLVSAQVPELNLSAGQMPTLPLTLWVTPGKSSSRSEPHCLNL